MWRVWFQEGRVYAKSWLWGGAGGGQSQGKTRIWDLDYRLRLERYGKCEHASFAPRHNLACFFVSVQLCDLHVPQNRGREWT
jgi:hypothetical protein